MKIVGKVSFRNRLAVALLAVFLLCPIQVWAWGSATHAHIGDKLGAISGLANLNEIYGAMGLDTFNYLFGSPYGAQLHNLAHHQAMKVWQAAQGGAPATLAVAYGFMSHNDDWGADYTAHHRGLSYGVNEGYVIAKTTALAASYAPLASLGLPDPIATEITHLVVETGVDVLLQALDPGIGQKIMAATQQRTAQFPALLVQAYAADLNLPYADAVALISGAEAQFQTLMYWYGYALTFPTDTAVQLLAGQFADLADMFLAGYGITLPLSKDEITLFLAGFIGAAMNLCSPDYAQEINLTIAFVDGQLKAHGVSPVPVPSSLALAAPILFGLGWQTWRRRS